MNIKFLSTPNIIPITALLGLSIAIMFMAAPAQAGVSIHLGYGHGGHHGYGHHSYGYGYGYPLYFGLHSYSRPYGYGRHHNSYGHRYGGYGYRSPYSSDYGNSSTPDYRDRSYDRGGANSTADGWVLLGNNQASAALTDFGRQAQASPSKGGPKVGYALASADLGQLDKGVWAMRRALRTDPGSLHYVTLDRHLDAKVKQIIGQYEKKLAYSARDADAAFMLASLHYLRRDIKAARTNIDQAMLVRHASSSTQNLRTLIDRER